MPLVSVLVLVALVELLTERLVGSVVRLDLLDSAHPAVHGVLRVAPFAAYLEAFLAIGTFAAVLIRIAVVGPGYRLGARFSFPLVGSIAVLLAVLSLYRPLSAEGFFHLRLSTTFLGLLSILSILGAPAPLRVRLGSIALLLPFLLRLGGQLVLHLAPGRNDAIALQLQDIAEVGIVVVSYAALPLLIPERPVWQLPLTFALTAVGVVTVVVSADLPLAAQLSLRVVGVDLPLHALGTSIYLGALATFLFVLSMLIFRPGAAGLRGHGMALVGLAGLGLNHPSLIAVFAVGMLCLVDAAVRSAEGSLTRAEFEALVRERAASLGAGNVTLDGADGYEVARFHPAGPQAVAVTLRRHAWTLGDLEIVVGEAPPRDPPFTARRRGTPRLGPSAGGPHLPTSDARFDTTFAIHDRRGVGGPLLDGPMRERMTAQLHGWVGVWPQRGVCYRAEGIPGDLAALVGLLVDMAAKTA